MTLVHFIEIGPRKLSWEAQMATIDEKSIAQVAILQKATGPGDIRAIFSASHTAGFIRRGPREVIGYFSIVHDDLFTPDEALYYDD